MRGEIDKARSLDPGRLDTARKHLSLELGNDNGAVNSLSIARGRDDGLDADEFWE